MTRAKQRILRVKGEHEIRTPILLPSFSSKGFPKLDKIFETMSEFIEDEILVSAYDIFHKNIEHDYDFASLVYLDSGGYEASKDVELSDVGTTEYQPLDWSETRHQEVVNGWSSLAPTLFVTYDHPKSRLPTSEQILRGKGLKLPEGINGRVLLLKPETEKSNYLHLAAIAPHIADMAGYAVIGVTEKEIGSSIFDRMRNIALLRDRLDEYHHNLPIHIFGSLDTISCYLYFLAGADIFDGLTWLRYAFRDGDTVYRQQAGILDLPGNTKSDMVQARCWQQNYLAMQTMRSAMARFTVDMNFKHFGKYAAQIERLNQDMQAGLGGR